MLEEEEGAVSKLVKMVRAYHKIAPGYTVIAWRMKEDEEVKMAEEF
ncbi:MAG: hypothetical protein HXS41_05345 [Theionarchaea archaeon]|nr:hypothetical protein [Theionarchaea archaeon]MBU7001816.1 hypothetical protein [Theionarchaea archaeon]MBU7020461.1 hypothetical protein [Theionarchaea archaeon]MBU7034759.1 hypothetical protein [Theionarchaea archaeon]MBU7041083.1 hypothetical protein [Theionarchaea archaeon]